MTGAWLPADDQREAVGQLADHVRGHHVVPHPALFAARPAAVAEADPFGERGLAAQLAGHLQRGGVGDAGQPALTPQVSRMTWAPSSPHRARSCASPWATGISWMPLPPESASHTGSGTGQICDDLVQGHQQRRIQPPARHGLPSLRGDVVDLAGHGGEQRGDRGVVVLGLGDQVQGAGLAQERLDVHAGGVTGRAARSGPAPGRS